MDERTTGELLKLLRSAKTEQRLTSYLESLDEDAVGLQFHEYFGAQPEVQAMKRSDLIAKSGIERTYFYQIMRGLRKPGRDKVLELGLAAGIDYRRIQNMLAICGAGSLYPKNRRDAILIFCIERRLQVSEVNELLLEFNEPLLS